MAVHSAMQVPSSRSRTGTPAFGLLARNVFLELEVARVEDIAFPFLANDLALDFVNMLVRTRGGDVDLVDTRDQMAKWVEAAGLSALAASWRSRELAAAADLRETIRSTVLALVRGQDPAGGALDRINHHLARYDPNLQVVQENGAYRLTHRDAAPPPAKILGLLAERTARLLTSDGELRMRECAHPDCVLLFKDTPKSGKRRWCSMQSCGNRAKVSTFRLSLER